MTRQASKGLYERYLWPVLAAVAVVGLFALLIIMTSRKQATNTENALWQALIFAVGIGITFYVGRQSVKEAAKDVIKPHGKAAVRRLVNLTGGIQQYSIVIDAERDAIRRIASENNGTLDLLYVEHSLDVIQAHIGGEIRTAADALEDWRDVVPEEVQAVEERSQREGQAE